ncbi:L-histidine N(alpha)-methyltransferase [Marinobacter sp.]|uniref:L-histidine N(alpha)-methyltransferase n=1 Tax=Marinobacter sp. TaxID=50741 RepID=UPI0034A5A105
MTTAVHFYDHQPTEAYSLSMQEDILRGLRAQPKYSSPKYLYDQRGSALFEEICQLPEYYLTRKEEAILATVVEEIGELAGEDVSLIDIGSGASRKVRLLLEHVNITNYLGIDLSRDFLFESTSILATDYPWLNVHAICADYSKRLPLPPELTEGRIVAFFPGSSIGNFSPAEASAFLAGIYTALPPGSGLLVGVDLIKERAILEAAYDDEAGVTAQFNLNLLSRLETELDAHLDPERFVHKAFFNDRFSRIEMHLVSTMAQVINVAGEAFRFQEGESIHTENSYKYSIEGFQVLAQRSGFSCRKVWTDGGGSFSVHYLEHQS